MLKKYIIVVLYCFVGCSLGLSSSLPVLPSLQRHNFSGNIHTDHIKKGHLMMYLYTGDRGKLPQYMQSKIPKKQKEYADECFKKVKIGCLKTEVRKKNLSDDTLVRLGLFNQTLPEETRNHVRVLAQKLVLKILEPLLDDNDISFQNNLINAFKTCSEKHKKVFLLKTLAIYSCIKGVVWSEPTINEFKDLVINLSNSILFEEKETNAKGEQLGYLINVKLNKPIDNVHYYFLKLSDKKWDPIVNELPTDIVAIFINNSGEIASMYPVAPFVFQNPFDISSYLHFCLNLEEENHDESNNANIQHIKNYLKITSTSVAPVLEGEEEGGEEEEREEEVKTNSNPFSVLLQSSSEEDSSSD